MEILRLEHHRADWGREGQVWGKGTGVLWGLKVPEWSSSASQAEGGQLVQWRCHVLCLYFKIYLYLLFIYIKFILK